MQEKYKNILLHIFLHENFLAETLVGHLKSATSMIFCNHFPDSLCTKHEADLSKENK